jgi:hypothetical protein
LYIYLFKGKADSPLSIKPIKNPVKQPGANDALTLAKLHQVMMQQELFKNPNLTLAELAKKCR